jgi:type I restriction enzyme S subunit
MNEAVRLKFICHLGYGDSLPKEDDLVGNIPVFGSNGPYATTSEKNTGVPSIVVGRKGPYGKLNWAQEGCFASDTTFFIDKELTNASLRWLYWALQTLKLDEGSQEAAVPGLNRDSVYEQRVLLPVDDHQQIIADYLDRETAHIDALLAEKERMLALLEEKRATLISHAVIQGLNPTVAIKHSGASWFDTIPKNWSVERLKWVITSVLSGVSVNASDQPVDGSAFGVLKTSAVFGGRFFPEENKSVWKKEFERLSCPVTCDTIIMSRMNTPALVGESGYVDCDYPNLFLPDRLWKISFDKERIHVPFMALLLSSKEARQALSSMATGTSPSMKNLAIEEMLSLLVPIPPLQEQIVIHQKLVVYEKRVILLREELLKSCLLLKERRTALITAAVTEQISTEEMSL